MPISESPISALRALMSITFGISIRLIHTFFYCMAESADRSDLATDTRMILFMQGISTVSRSTTDPITIPLVLVYEPFSDWIYFHVVHLSNFSCKPDLLTASHLLSV